MFGIFAYIYSPLETTTVPQNRRRETIDQMVFHYEKFVVDMFVRFVYFLRDDFKNHGETMTMEFYRSTGLIDILKDDVFFEKYVVKYLEAKRHACGMRSMDKVPVERVFSDFNPFFYEHFVKNIHAMDLDFFPGSRVKNDKWIYKHFVNPLVLNRVVTDYFSIDDLFFKLRGFRFSPVNKGINFFKRFALYVNEVYLKKLGFKMSFVTTASNPFPTRYNLKVDNYSMDNRVMFSYFRLESLDSKNVFLRFRPLNFYRVSIPEVERLVYKHLPSFYNIFFYDYAVRFASPDVKWLNKHSYKYFTMDDIYINYVLDDHTNVFQNDNL